MAYKRGNAGKTGLDLAQEEWERRMRMVFRQKDIKEDPEIPEEIECLIKKRNEKRQAKRVRLIKEIRRQGPLKHILYQYPARTDAGEGMRFARDNVEPFVGKTADISRWGIALYMLADLRADSSFNESYEKAMEIKDSDGKRIFHKADTKRLSMKDIGQIRKEGLKAIKEMGIADIKTSNPVLILIKLKKLSIQGKIDTKEAKAVYEVLRKTVKLEAMKGRQPPRLTRFTLRKVGNEIEKDDTGKEIVKTMRAAKKGRRLIRKMIRLTKAEYYNPKIIVRENRIRALNEEINRIGSVPSQDINIKSVPRNEPAVPQREHSFLRNFFKKREGAALPDGKKPKTSKGITKRFIKRAGARLKKARRIIGSGPGLFKILIPVTGFLLFIAVVLILVLGTAAAIADAVSFDTKSDKVKDLCFQCIKECYEEQINIITNYNSGGYYSNVVIKETDLKSNEAYAGDLAYTETTNITEMLSMATIYFEGDLSSATEEELVAYLKGLYHGSHVISASDDGSGTVTLTVTTYYFDDLFDVAVSDWQSNGSVISGTRIDIPQSFTQVMTYEPFNYENLTGEHYWNYACRNMWKIWTEQGQKADEGLCYIETSGTKFYLVAVYEPTFGKVGDYIDFYFPDRDYVMHCIIADTKGADEA
ncbi:MAG: hypothetical protein IJH60_00030, partial [Eubacterium sp.]|nr:hypothetical protein [Eubacterium sp.]